MCILYEKVGKHNNFCETQRIKTWVNIRWGCDLSVPSKNQVCGVRLRFFKIILMCGWLSFFFLRKPVGRTKISKALKKVSAKNDFHRIFEFDFWSQNFEPWKDTSFADFCRTFLSETQLWRYFDRHSRKYFTVENPKFIWGDRCNFILLSKISLNVFKAKIQPIPF